MGIKEEIEKEIARIRKEMGSSSLNQSDWRASAIQAQYTIALSNLYIALSNIK